MYLSISTLRLLLVFLATFTTRVFSALTITVTPSNQLPNPNSLPAGTHATLTSLPTSRHGEENYNAVLHPLTAPLTRSGTFIFWDLRSPKPESYLLDIHSAEYVFPPLRVDVSVDGKVLGIWETFRGNPWENRGAEKFAVTTATSETTTEVLDVAVEIKPLARRGFYEERAKFSPLALFKNPMILMALVAMGFTFGMPKLMENMDPEMRAEFEKQSRSSPISSATRNAMASGGGAQAGFDLAGWMAGAAPRTAASQGSSTGRDSGDHIRRR
ncbi:uncharacterized protein ATNIH1004_006245 [Aspergillus tanneri]|uniref:ER membrane protein complex subunit 7 beta-sandwich domain-containing protein n=1 Tax=Aspergillus tanneri TaxID=1220188 RepID=A0A5M9MKL3_9EURO|nr:uncharacterized protein ATNIH1004_006245 [Aspergillus tanneri]KAA8647551.1 hypothetical protein ATNIH1004_006245 [Aspergillus tanneri]